MTIHSSHPFADAADHRDAARRFRGRLAAPVTLWAAGEGASRVGLTVSQVLVALGEPAHVVGLIDPDTDLADALAPGTPFVVAVLNATQRRLVEVFAGLGPAPGGPFTAAPFEPTEWGPRPAASDTWLGARVTQVTGLGWSQQVTGRVERVVVGGADPLVHLRGRLLAP